MGCNTSQELKGKKTDDESAGVGAAEKTGEDGAAAEQQTPATMNGDASATEMEAEAEAGNNTQPPPPSSSTSVEDSCAVKNVPSSLKSSSGTTKPTTTTTTGCESEQNAKNNGIQSNKQQSKSSPAGDVTDGKHHHNSLLNGDIKDDGHRIKLCEKAEITELNNVDIDGDDEDDSEADGDDEAKAATKIQAAFRGHKVRATMKKSDDTSAAAAGGAATTAQNKNNNAPAEAKEKSMATAPAAAAAVDNADPTKEELEAEFDPNDKELCDAALKIQATFRGHLSRKLAGQKAEEVEVDIQEITKKVAEELDIDLTDPELNKAATKIQASFRGHKSRKDATN